MACDVRKRALARQLYALVTSGRDGLPFNVDRRGPGYTTSIADYGSRQLLDCIPDRSTGPAWRRAKERCKVRGEGGEVVGTEDVDRRFTPGVAFSHICGAFSVAPAAPGWVQWCALDIDAHRRSGESEMVARLRAGRMLGQVWRVLNCSTDRHPLVMRSPGGGYHVWFPLTRERTSLNREHTWPSQIVRDRFKEHLEQAGLPIKDGDLELFPSHQHLRLPCGAGMVLLQAKRPDSPDALELEPWPGTMRPSRVDWRGTESTLSTPVRNVEAQVSAFVAQWEPQRRTIAEWLGRPEASWDDAWGPLRRRPGLRFVGSRIAEKNPAGTAGVVRRSQQLAEEAACPPQALGGAPARAHRKGAGRSRGSGSDPTPGEANTPSAPEVDIPPDPAGGHLVYGRAFKQKVARLLAEGITQAHRRHNSVLALAFYWAATCGFGIEESLARLEKWCRKHAHGASLTAASPKRFVAECLQEARHYIKNYVNRWPFRGRGESGGLGTLSTADQAVLDAVDPRVRAEAGAMLAWFAGRADGEGRVGDPVELATGLLAQLCGDRRVDDGGKRRRATTLAQTELERLGLMTLARNYCVGKRGRMWSCWYQFGSGVLPRTQEMTAAEWEGMTPSARQAAAKPPPESPRAPKTPSEAPSALKTPLEAPSAPIVTVRVLGERVVPEGLLRVLSDGARGAVRTLLEIAPEVGRPTVEPCTAWFEKKYWRTFTPLEFWAADLGKLLQFPPTHADDVRELDRQRAERKRMSRDERIRLGGGGAPAPVIALGSAHRKPSTSTVGLAQEPAMAYAEIPELAVAAEPATAEVNIPGGFEISLAPQPGGLAQVIPLQLARDEASTSAVLLALTPQLAMAQAESELTGNGSAPAARHVELSAVLGDAAAELPRDLAEVLEAALRAYDRNGKREPDG